MNDIFKSDADIWVIPVNCVGVMSAGLAKQFKEKRPIYFKHYRNACDFGDIYLGYPYIEGTSLDDPKYICYFPTKHHWKDKSNLIAIDIGLYGLKLKIQSFIAMHWLDMKPSVAVPKLGCGLGGLKWSDVKPLIEEHLGQFNIIYLE